MKPITRKEYYLAKAAGTYTGPTPPPVLREDYYLATLAGDYSGYCPAPVTRLDMFMSAAAELTSYVPQPITRLEMYWYNIAKGTGYVPEPVTREEQLLYAIIHKEPQYIDKTAEGNPILLTDSAEAPLTALTLYGWSKQDGTPSPDDPVPIESAGSVMTTGAQLIDTSLIPPYGEWDGEHDGVYLKDERTWFLKVPNNNSVARVWNEDFTKARTWGELMPTLSVGDTITFGQNVDLNETNNITYNSDSGLVVRQGDSVTVTQGFLDALAQFYGVDGADTTCERVEIQINRGTTPLPWEPYTGGQPAANPYEGEIDVTISDGGTQSQFLTVSAHGGLPGIPVDASKLPEGMTPTYVDESGQAWVCDEVDFKRGKYVQRVWRKTFDWSEDEVWRTYPSINQEGFYCADALPEVMATRASLCNQLIPYDSISPDNAIRLGANNKYIYCTRSSFYDPSLEDSGLANWKAHLAAHPLEVMTYLETPIETDLTAEEMASYKALHTYSPATTVSNDAGAWMKVGYKTPAE